MDRRCVYDNVGRVADVGSPLAVIYPGAFFLKGVGESAFFRVRTGNMESFLQKDLGKSAHTDAADADKMYGKRCVKVYLIHNKISLI